MKNRIIAGLAVILVAIIGIFAIKLDILQPKTNISPVKAEGSNEAGKVVQAGESNKTAAVQANKKPKYIFLFIGDGMSYPQIQSANYYLNALANGSSMGNKEQKTILERKEDRIGFVSFPVAGSAQTYDSTSFCPDSASTATSISTGHKTYSGTINMSEDASTVYETISEKLHKQLGYKIGILSSVNLNHATPAAFYAHQDKRSKYYEIAKELVSSGFDYFAGGGLLKPTGKEKDQEDIYKLAEQAGYKVVRKQSEAEKLNKDSGKVLLIDEHLADSDAMAYEIDREDGQWSLADHVSKAIEVLNDGQKGFFMMVEGGKIDWACHANDAATTIGETKAFADSVNAAVRFYEAHPDETLILVTGDHETGGLTIGYSGTNYDTFLENLGSQKISFQKFDQDFVTRYREQQTPYEEVLKDIADQFGLRVDENAGEAGSSQDSKDEHPTSASSGKLILSEYEREQLREAYDATMARDPENKKELSQREFELYGSYEPLTVTITHLLNRKSGIAFNSYAHTGLPVAVYARGCGQQVFEGYYDNTDIFKRLSTLMEVK